MNETEELNSLLRERYNVLNDKNVVAIRPSLLANEVYSVIDPDSIAPSLVHRAAVLELCQLARSICRQRFESEQREAEYGSLFDMQLQPRYPATRDSEDAYVLRQHLTAEERYRNIARLTKEAGAKQLHADALKAETEDLIRSGVLVEAGSLA